MVNFNNRKKSYIALLIYFECVAGGVILLVRCYEYCDPYISCIQPSPQSANNHILTRSIIFRILANDQNKNNE